MAAGKWRGATLAGLTQTHGAGSSGSVWFKLNIAASPD